MAKSGNDDLKDIGSDALQVIGPLKKLVEDATKSCQLMAKNPNPKLAEQLADQIETLLGEFNDIKNLLKDIKKVI